MIRILLPLLVATTLSAQNYRITTTPPAAVDPSQPAPWRIVIENISGTAQPELPLFLHFSPGVVQTVSEELRCNVSSSDVACTLPALAPGASVVIDATVRHPFRFGRIAGGAVIRSAEPAQPPQSVVDVFVFWREFAVTTTADAGPGSLRQTILDINAAPECRYRPGEWQTPCKAAFRIADPVPAEGWYTIRPSAPLPALTAFDTAIDGTTQTAANARGPAVGLDGSALAFGNGVTCDGAAALNHCEIRGLAIGGFPWNGIFGTARSQLTVRQSYIGVDPTGQRAHANGSRGIASALMRGLVADSVISGNRRSGVFFMGTEGTGPSIRNNRIGVAAHDDTPIGNGASGIFIGNFFGYYANPTIEGNVIANNEHFGIALAPNAPMIVLANTVRNNGGGGIDIGLDGPTESAPGVPAVEGGVVAAPVIVSAVYANGVTTIKGYTAQRGISDRRQVLLYANTTLEPGGFAEGEQFLGKTPVQFREDTSFTFVYPGDLRGKYINGTVFAVTHWGWDEYTYTTSEFGRALAVEE